MELDDHIVAIPVGKNIADFRGVIKMNETAARILELLKNDISEIEIVESLVEEYEVARELLSEDVHKCILELQDKGLLE